MDNPKTVEELIQTPQYKIVTKAVMKKFPWVIKITPSEPVDQYESIYFLELYIDINKLIATYGLEPNFILDNYVKNHKTLGLTEWVQLPFMGVLFEDSDKVRRIVSEIDKDLHNVDKSDLLRKTKLSKTFAVSGFLWQPISYNPPDEPSVDNS